MWRYRLGEKPNFLDEVMASSGQNLLACLQCGKCSGSCPITTETVGGPRQLVAKILYNQREAALQDPTWWYCVSCGTCMTRCPVEINMYAVATTLSEMAEAAGVEPAVPEIELFDRLFLESVAKYGRAQEVQVVMRYNLQTLQPFRDLGSGLRLLLKGALKPADLRRQVPLHPRSQQLFARRQAEKRRMQP